ncbi:MAG: PrgI family protein [Bacillus sp. (in: Bacteria)]|nr:PrgI family protein [Bacillus sp. (in: firmicutes)]MCM1427853.1 PrgI family protein [Eubacterium sp.]
MAYVNMTKDFSNVKMNIPGLRVTKRQVIAILSAACIGLPVFYIMRYKLNMNVTNAIFGIMFSGFPAAFIILYKKDGLGMEKHIKYFYETHFVRNTERPYRTDNLYDLMQEEEKLKKEVERIVFKGKTQKEIEQILESGETTEVKIDGKKIVVPLKGKIDPKVKKELEKAVKKAKVKGSIPESAQDTIPYKIPYEDGIFESADGYFTQTMAYEDVNYELLDNDPKNTLFERWCTLINYFEPDIHFQFNYGCMEIDKKKYTKNFELRPQEDSYNAVRKEYSDMLVDKFSKGTNNLSKERYLTYGIHAKDYKSAKIKLNKISKQIESKLKRLNSRSRLLNGYERLELIFRIFHPGTSETLLWNFDMPVKTGLSSKDFITPSSFSFKSGIDLNATRYFRVGERIGAVNYIQVFASDMEDRIIADMLNLNSNIWITIHADNIPRKDAINIAKNNVINIQAMIQGEQKDAVKSGYDMDLLPPELKTYKEAGDKLYNDLQRKDEKMFNAVITVVQTAATRKELENNIFELNGILAAYQCRLSRLDNRQEQGYMSSLPLGNNMIDIKRTFTTTDMAIFIPFTTKEMFSPNGQYYGMNTLSNNVIMVNRKRLANPNGLVFGQPGFGKTFFTKREILDVFLKTRDDRMIIDPEGEYKWLVKLLGGQVIRVALNSNIYINPMEINLTAKNEADRDYDPIAAKCNFVVSMCELILGNNANLGKKEVAVIDEACKQVYYKYTNNPIPGNMPILEDLYNELRNMKGEKAAIGLDLSIALSRYVSGTLSYFNHRSNVDINSRFVCFDLKEMNANQRDLTMLIIQDTIWNRVADNREAGKYTWVDIDEFHLLLRSPITAAYSVEIWKRFRKWGGIPTGITQNIKDLFRSMEIQNILDTTNFIVMLNQAGDDARLLAEHLDLSEEEEGYLKSGEPGKGLLWVEQSKVPFEDEFPRNTRCYTVMTTKPGEAIRKRKKTS